MAHIGVARLASSDRMGGPAGGAFMVQFAGQFIASGVILCA